MEERPRRTFSEPPKRRGLGDTDAAEGVTRLRALTNGLFGGALGALLGFFLVQRGAPFWVAVVCVVCGWRFVSLGTAWIVSSAGAAASTLYTPSGRSTPRQKEHSRAEALVAQGRYQEAVDVFEMAVAEDPSDGAAYLRIARIYRDHLAKPEAAARWFRRALREATLPAGQAGLARKELVELFAHRLGTPERALPDLARIAEDLAGTPEGEWASVQIREIKARMAAAPTPTSPRAHPGGGSP
ncbi:MAG: tetratricopeptide repeat protein [Gemmatimonadetes bacterium]|nr:tetratricopeptide repeat protein [Gemmatimonadota bacterium]